MKNKSAQQKNLIKVLKQFNIKKRFILDTISETEKPEELKFMRRDLDIIHAQRQKGIAIVISMNRSDSKFNHNL